MVQAVSQKNCRFLYNRTRSFV